VATLLADPPAGQAGSPTAPPAADGAQAAQVAPEATTPCANCGAPLAPGQDWCLQCGRGAPGSLGGAGPGWGSGAAALGAIALLVAGAGGAADAALCQSTPRPPGAGGAATAPGGVLGAVPKVGAPTTVKPTVPLPSTKAVLPGAGKVTVPKVAIPTPVPAPATNKAASGGAPAEAEAQGSAITLDTNAAATYNPYNYPASDFGDPSLAIDGETSTAWTARVNPAVAPRMAEGLMIDLKSPQRVVALALTTSTPGLAVQVYGADGSAAPASITDPAWKRLTGLRVVRKHKARIALSSPAKTFRFVVLWISRAPASASHVSVNELELFPPRK
jgi:hypothetical protein